MGSSPRPPIEFELQIFIRMTNISRPILVFTFKKALQRINDHRTWRIEHVQSDLEILMKISFNSEMNACYRL